MAANRPVGGGTAIGTGQLQLVTPHTLNITDLKRAAYCKKDDDWPGHFVSSLNYTFPDTPPLSAADLKSAGLDPGADDFSFDCFLELPGGIVTFEVCLVPRLRDSKKLTPLSRIHVILLKPPLQIKGDIDSHFKLVFEVWMSVTFFNYRIGVYSCDLLALDKDPCAFDLNTRYFQGQGGLYPEDDSDPDFVDLCLEVQGTVEVPYTRIKKSVNFRKCFTKVPRNKTPPKATS